MNVFISSKVRSNRQLAGGFRAKSAVTRRTRSKNNSIITQKYRQFSKEQSGQTTVKNYDPYAIAEGVLQQQDKIEDVKIKKGLIGLKSDVKNDHPLQIPSAVIPTEQSSVGNFTQDHIKGLQTLVKQDHPETEKQTLSPKSANNQIVDQKDFEAINKNQKMKSPRSRISKLQTKIQTQTTDQMEGRHSENMQGKFVLQKNSSKSLVLGQILQRRNSIKSAKRKMEHILKSKDKLNDDLEEDQSEPSPHKWARKGYTSHSKKNLKSPSKIMSPKELSRRNSDYVGHSSKESKANQLGRDYDPNTKTLKLAAAATDQINQDIEENAPLLNHNVTVASNEIRRNKQDILRETESDRKILVDNSSGALPTNKGNDQNSKQSKEDSITIQRVMSEDIPFAATSLKKNGFKKDRKNPRIMSAVSKASKTSNSSIDPDLIKFYMAFQSQSPSSRLPIQPHGVSFQKDLSKWRKAASGMKKALKKIAVTKQGESKEDKTEQSTDLNQYGLRQKKGSIPPSADGSTVRGQFAQKYNDSPSLNLAQNRGFLQFKRNSIEQQQYEQRVLNNQGMTPNSGSGTPSNIGGPLKIQTNQDPPSPDFNVDQALNDRASPLVAVQLTPADKVLSNQSKVDLKTNSTIYQTENARKRPESSDRIQIQTKQNSKEENIEVPKTQDTNEARQEVNIVQENEQQLEIKIVNSFEQRANILNNDQSLTQSLGETEDTKKAFAVQYVNQEPHITWEQLQGMHQEQVDAIINLQVGLDHPMDEKMMKQLNMNKSNTQQESVKQLSGMPMSPQLISIPQSESTIEKIQSQENIQIVANATHSMPHQSQEREALMNGTGKTNSAFKLMGNQTFGIDQQQNPVSQAYITKLEQSQESMEKQSKKTTEEKAFEERPRDSRLLRLAWAGYTRGDWKSGKSQEKNYYKTASTFNRNIRDSIDVSNEAELDQIKEKIKQRLLSQSPSCANSKRFLKDCEASREKERNYRYPNPIRNQKDHRSASPLIDQRSPHRGPDLGPMPPLLYQDDISGRLSRPLLACKAQLSAVLQGNAMRRKFMEQDLIEQTFVSELRESGLLKSNGDLNETTRQNQESKTEGNKSSITGQKQMLKNLVELGSMISDTTITEEALQNLSQQMQLYMTNLALGNQDDIQLALELERVQREHRAKPYSQFINFPSSVKKIIERAALDEKLSETPHSPAFYTRIRSQSGPTTVNRIKSAQRRQEEKRNLFAAKMKIVEPVKVEVNLTRQFDETQVQNSQDNDEKMQNVMTNINEQHSIFAKAMIDERGVCASLTVQLDNQPVILSDSHQSTHKLSQHQISQKMSPQASRKTGKSLSPTKDLNSQKHFLTQSSHGGANLLVQKAIQNKQASTRFVYTENKGVRDSFSAQLKGIRDSVGVISSGGIQGKTVIPKQLFNMIDQLQNDDDYINQIQAVKDEQADMVISAHTIDNLVSDPQMISKMPNRMSSRNINQINMSKKGQEASAKSMVTLHSDQEVGKFLRKGIYMHQINKISNASIAQPQRQSMHQDFSMTGPSQTNLQPTQLLMQQAPSFHAPSFAAGTGYQTQQDPSPNKQINRDGSVLTQFIGDVSVTPVEQKSLVIEESRNSKDQDIYKVSGGAKGNVSVRNDTTDKVIMVDQEPDNQPKQKTSVSKTASKIISKSQMNMGQSKESKNELNEYVNTNLSPSDDQYLRKPDDVSATLKQGPSSVQLQQNENVKINEVRDSPMSNTGQTPLQMLGRLESKETVLKRNITPQKSKEMNKDMKEVASPVNHLRSPKLAASPTAIKVESVHSFDPIIRKSMEHDPGTIYASKRSSAFRKKTKFGYKVPYPEDKPKILRDPESYVNRMNLQFQTDKDGLGRFQPKSIVLKSGQNGKDIIKMISNQKNKSIKPKLQYDEDDQNHESPGKSVPASPTRQDLENTLNKASEVALSGASQGKQERNLEHLNASANHQKTKIKTQAEIEIENIRQKRLHANLSKNSAKQAEGLLRLLSGANLEEFYPEQVAQTSNSTVPCLQRRQGDQNHQNSEIRESARPLSNHSIISQNLQKSIQPVQTQISTHNGTVIEIAHHSNRQSQNRSLNLKSKLVTRHRQNMSQAPIRRERQFSRPVSSNMGGNTGTRPGTSNLITAMQNISQGLAQNIVAEPQIIQAGVQQKGQAQNAKSQKPLLSNYQSQPHPNTLTITGTNGFISQDSLDDAAHGLRDAIKSIEPKRNFINKSANMPARNMKHNWALNHEMDALVDAPVLITHNQSDLMKKLNQDKTSSLFKGKKMIPRRAGPRQLTAHATKSVRAGKSANENRSLFSGTGTRDDSAGAWLSNK